MQFQLEISGGCLPDQHKVLRLIPNHEGRRWSERHVAGKEHEPTPTPSTEYRFVLGFVLFWYRVTRGSPGLMLLMLSRLPKMTLNI